MGSNKKWLITLAAVLVIGGGVSGYFFVTRGDSGDTAQADETETQIAKITESSKDIVVVVGENKSLTTFASAITAAALTGTLQGAGPYTVLVPTDEAFKSLPTGTLERLLKAENLKQLTDILNYHVISAKLAAADLTNGQKVKTINGQELTVEVSDAQIAFIDAKGGKAVVEKANVSTSNGVIHIVNAVLLPQ